MKHLISVLLAVTFASPAPAQEPAPPAAMEPVAETGRPLSTTAEWLQWQRTGAQRGAPNALPGEALELLYQRYLGRFGPGATGAMPHPGQVAE